MGNYHMIKQQNIYHVFGTGRDVPPDGSNSWLDYWKKNTGISKPKCCIQNCGSDAEVGAHIRLTDKRDAPIYIVPTCEKHNLQGKAEKQMSVNRGIRAVPVN